MAKAKRNIKNKKDKVKGACAQKSSKASDVKGSVSFEQVVSRACGLDVHKKTVVASIGGDGIESTTKTFATFTEDLEALGTWLKDNGVVHIAMESTGVYWKPIYNILEADFEILLVNARHIKNVPGKKTDKKDSEWICKLLLSGLLSGSFVPPRHIRELRDLTRYRSKLIQQVASEKNRLQKILEDGNIKLSSVVSSMSGKSATRIVDALIEGETDPDKLFSLCHGKLKSKEREILSAVKGNLTPHHKFMLMTIKKSIAEKESIIQSLNAEIDFRLEENQLVLDAELLQSIPGVGKESSECIIAEIGNDMSRFPSSKHLASWAGLSPGNNESAGKKKTLVLRTATII